MTSLVNLRELQSCRHCLVGTVVLETHTRNVSPFIGGPPQLKTTETCYCSTCGTLFHAPTFLKKLDTKKP